MKTPATRLEMMWAASLIQNPRIMPREVKPEELHGRGERIRSALTDNAPPATVEQIEGKSEGVQRAKRAESQERTGVQ